ncbi:DUF1932 domain-containing protein [Roseicyclus sp. F158]|uniref:DUF1932 domain-containing protein n=1 Tax=Tropicimonas omnivorans TaxID=3075590 RepID=A0ABU3DCK8_9RHOB|nr:DUF1932 domain-containing protein [Roseicyclus sp. F158]MDT0681437.1 DUF1932 domain-containing protein [Roseicyclus sp. F158]
MRIAFIGFGEAARAFTDTLRETGDHSFSAFDRKTDDDMEAAMAARFVRLGGSPEDAMSGADWVFSAVTADESLNAAMSAVPHLVQGQIFVDLNSVSPGRKRETAEKVTEAGGRYLDMAVMAPVHPRGHATPVFLAGPEAETLHADLDAAGFAAEVVGTEPGEATAIKMVRSLFVKGLEAITVEALLAASVSGCFDRVLSSLSKSYPALGWPDHATYAFERTLHHGARRAAEMRESAATLDELGLTGGLAAQIAEVQDKQGAAPMTDLPDLPFEEAVAALAQIRKGA